MNFEKLQIVRDTIASKPEHFNMANFFGRTSNDAKMPKRAGEFLTTCGTVACIAGYTIAIFKPNHNIYCISAIARRILEISTEEGNYIFCGYWSLNDFSNISVEETLWYLDGVLKTKDIRWNKNSGEYWPTNNEE